MCSYSTAEISLTVTENHSTTITTTNKVSLSRSDGPEARPVGKPYGCGLTPGGRCSKELVGMWTSGMKGECVGAQAGFRIGKTGYRKMALQVINGQ